MHRLGARAIERLRGYWRALLLQGTAMFAIGVLALLLPAVATFAVEINFSWLLVVAGLVRLIAYRGLRHMTGFTWLAVAGAALSVVAGVLLLWQPLVGIVLLSALMAGLFLADGVGLIVFATADLVHLSASRWPSALVGVASAWWALAIGVLDIVLATLIAIGWPGATTWVLGLLLGVNLTIGRLTLMLTAIALRTTDGTPVAASSTESWRRAARPPCLQRRGASCRRAISCRAHRRGRSGRCGRSWPRCTASAPAASRNWAPDRRRPAPPGGWRRTRGVAPRVPV